MKDLAVVISNDNEVSAKETIDAIYNAGFKNVFIQWYDKDYKEFDLPQQGQLDYARSKGLNVIFAHLGYKGINDIWTNDGIGEELVEKYIRNLDEMKANNINLVVMHMCAGENPPNISLLGLKRFEKIVKHAKDLGINIAFENTKVKGYQEYALDNLDYDNVGICFDSGHMHCHFNDEFNFEYFKDKIMCVHLHDNHGNADEHLLPFDGTLNFDLVLDGLSKANYKEYFTFELCYRRSYCDKMNVEEFYKEGYQRGLKLIKKYKEN